MVGNDVVDLGCAEVVNGPAHPRFDARVFTPDERRAMAASPDPDRTRWILWAAKEAAYKLRKQADEATVFSPVRFETTLDGGLRGAVRHEAATIPVEVRVDGDLVHAIAGPTRATIAGATTHDCDDPSAAVRIFTVRTLAAVLGVEPSRLSVRRDGRIPRLACEGRERPLSLSHHGRYVAFACDLGEAA